MFLGLILLCSTGCTSLPTLEKRTVSTAFTDTVDTRLGRQLAPLEAAHPGLSGLTPLLDGHDAFAARIALARSAQRSLDVQYYIWRHDLSGTLLFDELRRAADRGVRVRLLLDDYGTAGNDDFLAALDAHPLIEVRLFNPFALRHTRWLNFPLDFSRLNRRMHNKSFTADNQATIIGGRNIGDEYFEAGPDVLFIDLDALAIGAVVHEVSRVFDDYWACSSAYPVHRLLGPPSPGEISRVQTEADRLRKSPRAQTYLRSVDAPGFVEKITSGALVSDWAKVTVLADDPAKGLGRAADSGLLTTHLWETIGQPAHSLDLVSPYFVPTQSGVASFAAMAKQGVKVRVLTNALEATDVAVVHSGYAKRRPALLASGVELYEIKSTAKRPVRIFRRGGRSHSSLHAKTFALDGRRVFVGSFNFDPRSARLNTELGFMIESPLLAREINEAFDELVPQQSYQVRLGPSGRLQWVTPRADGSEEMLDREPGTTPWQRGALWFLAHLPIEPLL